MNRSSSTLLDLAKRAGVAKSTASMALRGDVRIRAEPRLRTIHAPPSRRAAQRFCQSRSPRR